MLWIIAIFGLLSTTAFVFKATVIWSASHDIYNSGGVPTLDFPIFYPVFIAEFFTLALRLTDFYPFPYFVVCLWYVLMLGS